MPEKRPAKPSPAQLVFPFELRVGDVILDEGSRAEVVAPPTGGPAWKTTHAWVRHEGDTARMAMAWEAWRQVRIVRRAAA